MGPRLLARATGVIALAVLVAAPVAARARHGGWSGPVAISVIGHLGVYPKMAFDGRGRATAVWMELAGSGTDYVVKASQRRAQGTSWSQAAALSRTNATSLFPELAVNGSGAAVVAWDVSSTAASGARVPSVEAATRAPGNRIWSPPRQISSPTTQAEQVALAIDGGGRAIAVWSSESHGESRIEESEAVSGKGAWSHPAVLARARAPLLAPQVGMSRRGSAIVIWNQMTGGGVLAPGGTHGAVVVTVRAAGGRSWSAPQTLGSENEAGSQGAASFESAGPRLAVDARGDAVVVWQRRHAGRIVAANSVRLATTGRWTKATWIADEPALFPRVSVDPAGDATVVWEGRAGRVRAATKPISACGWSRPATLSRGRADAVYANVAMDAYGDAVATWTATGVEAAILGGPRGRWGRPHRLGSGGLPQAAVAPRGQAIIVWQRPTTHPSGIVVDAASHRALRASASPAAANPRQVCAGHVRRQPSAGAQP